MKKSILLFTGIIILSFINQAQTVTDYDGNIYHTVNIGTQIWMKENLKVTRYRNGDEIPKVTDNTSWLNQTNGARCYYNNDSVIYSGLYGTLYNWFTTIDSRNLCPEYWHVPNDQEWATLINFAYGSPYADTLLCNGCLLGFDALLGGLRSGLDGDFFNENNFAYFWSSTEESASRAWNYGGFRKTAPQMNNRDYNFKVAGLSIRCISDSTTQIKDINSHEGFQIYPNPANDFITFEGMKESMLFIYNTSGQLLISQKINETKSIINIKSLPIGVCFVKITNADTFAVKKLVKK